MPIISSTSGSLKDQASVIGFLCNKRLGLEELEHKANALSNQPLIFTSVTMLDIVFFLEATYTFQDKEIWYAETIRIKQEWLKRQLFRVSNPEGGIPIISIQAQNACIIFLHRAIEPGGSVQV